MSYPLAAQGRLFKTILRDGRLSLCTRKQKRARERVGDRHSKYSKQEVDNIPSSPERLFSPCLNRLQLLAVTAPPEPPWRLSIPSCLFCGEEAKPGKGFRTQGQSRQPIGKLAKFRCKGKAWNQTNSMNVQRAIGTRYSLGVGVERGSYFLFPLLYKKNKTNKISKDRCGFPK